MKPVSAEPRKASIDDVASLAGVSTATVSRTFSKPNMVSAKTRAKVEQAADKLGFYVSRTAAILKSGQLHRIALFFGGEQIDWFTSCVIEGLNSVLRPQNYDLAVYPIGDHADRQDLFSQMQLRGNADAVIVSSFTVNENQVRRLKEAGIPIIGVNSFSPNFSASVYIDDANATRTAMNYLMNLGHRDIAYVYEKFISPLEYSSHARLKAFKQICEETPQLNGTIITLTHGTDERSHVVEEWLRAHPRPTAMLFHQDSLAIPFFFTMQQSGIRIPDDVSIMGFDDSQFADAVGLTTTWQNPVAMAAEAARKTLALINGGALESQHELMPTHLIIRQSAIMRP